MRAFLEDKTIVVTRPVAQAHGLITELENVGARVVGVPLLDITALPLEAKLEHVLKQSTHVDALICVSVNAAEIGLRYCRELDVRLPTTVIAVGKATAAVLRAGGVDYVLQGGAASNSEEILALPSLRDITGNNINIWRGGDGRTLLGDTLEARGAKVTFVDLYQRIEPADLARQVNQFVAPEVDIITVSSIAALENLIKVAADELTVLKTKTLLVGSQRIQQDAVEHGFSPENVIVATNPGDSEMLAALKAQLQKKGKLMTEEIEKTDELETGEVELSSQDDALEAEIDGAESTSNNKDHMEQEPLAKPVTRSGSKFGTILATLSFLLAAGGIAGAYYFYEKEIKPALSASASTDDFQELNSKIQKQTSRLQTMDSQVEKTAEGVSELRSTVSAERTPLILAQVEHLIELANDRLTYMSDTATASAALEDAMGRMDSINQPGYVSVRNAIVADLERVRSYQDVDADEVLSGLASLISELRPLPSSVPLENEDVAVNNESEVEVAQDSEKPKTIAGAWKKFTESIANQVTVTKNDNPVSGFSATAINRYKLELLQLRLEAMRLSLLRDDMVSFNTEVVEAQTWSIKNLDGSVAQPILTELLRLRRLNFAVVPNLQNSLSEVRRAIAKSAPQVNSGNGNQSILPAVQNFAPAQTPSTVELEIQRQRNRLPPPLGDDCGSCSLPELEIEEGTAL